MKRVLLGLVAVLSIAVALVIPVPWLFGMVEGTADTPPLLVHFVERLAASPGVFLVHVVFGGVALLAGPWQLMPRLRARWPRLHRVAGGVYVGAVALAGSAGLVMGPSAWGGPVAASGFTALAIAWLGTTAVGLQRIVVGDRAGHRAWMTRSFALAFAAVSLRIQVMLMRMGDVSPEVAYAIVAWSSWVPNLLVAHAALVRRNSAGERPVQRRNARVNELCSENPSR